MIFFQYLILLEIDGHMCNHAAIKHRYFPADSVAVLFIHSDLTTCARCVQFLSVILLISSAFHVANSHLWTSLLSVSAHAWVECGTAPTTTAQVCAFPVRVVNLGFTPNALQDTLDNVLTGLLRKEEGN